MTLQATSLRTYLRTGEMNFTAMTCVNARKLASGNVPTTVFACDPAPDGANPVVRNGSSTVQEPCTSHTSYLWSERKEL